VSDAAIVERVMRALDEVLDPCSVGIGSPTSLTELGLIERVDSLDGQVTVHMCVTAPVCLMVAPMFEAIRTAVESLPGVRSVETRLDPNIVWTPARMSRDHAARLAETRAARQRVSGVMPQAWRGAASAGTR
jgi:metal-sulfur cluster biosynthetic enzyme